MVSHDPVPEQREDKGTSPEPACPAGPVSPEHALEALLNHISRSAGFPAFLANIQEIMSFQANPYFTVHDISRVILRDLSMTTQILKLVNSIYFQTYQRQVHTVSGAVMLLGLEHVRELALGLKLFENFRQSSSLKAVKQLVLSAFLTAIQSQELARKEENLKDEEVFLTALLFNWGELMVAYYFPGKHQQIQKMAAAQNIRKSAAAKEILHVSLEELGLAILKLWNFPSNLINRLSAFHFGGIALTGPEGRLKKIIVGADCLARILLNDNLTQEEWQHQRAKLGRSLGIKPDFLEESLAASLERFQTLAQILKVNLKDTAFTANLNVTETKKAKSQLPGDSDKAQEIAAAPKPAPPAPSLTAENDEEIQRLKFLYQVLAEIHQAMADKAAINQVLDLVMEGLYRGLGFDRVAFCLVSSDRTWLTSRYGLGERVEKLLPLLSTPLTAKKNALALALRQHQEYLVNPYNQPADYLLMDEGFWQMSGTQVFLVSPIHVEQVPIGLFYVDRCKPQAVITELERQRLRSFRDLTILSIRLNSRSVSSEV